MKKSLGNTSRKNASAGSVTSAPTIAASTIGLTASAWTEASTISSVYLQGD